MESNGNPFIMDMTYQSRDNFTFFFYTGNKTNSPMMNTNCWPLDVDAGLNWILSSWSIFSSVLYDWRKFDIRIKGKRLFFSLRCKKTLYVLSIADNMKFVLLQDYMLHCKNLPMIPMSLNFPEIAKWSEWN